MFEVGVGPILYGFELIYSIILRYHFDFSWGLLTLKATNVVSKLHDMYPPFTAYEVCETQLYD
jgi:hypothetical protein